MIDHLLFDTTDAQSMLDSANVGAYVRASDGSLVTHHQQVSDDKAMLVTQGLIIKSKLAGAVGNTYSFEVIDSGSGAIIYSEVSGAVQVNLQGNSATSAQIVTLLSGSAYVDVTAGIPAGSVVVASAINLAGGKDSELHNYLDVFAPLHDGDGNPISSTAGSLNVNMTNVPSINADLDGIYSGGNTSPDNVGLIGFVRAASPALTDQTFTFTGATPTADSIVAANVHAMDVNSFLMGFNGTTFDRLKSTSGSLDINDGGNSLTVDGTVAATQSGTWTIDSITNDVNIADGGNSITVDAIDLDIRDLVFTQDSITAHQGGTWTIDSITNDVSIDDGGNSITVDGSVSITGTVAVTQSGTWSVGLTEDHNYGTVGASTLRTAAQIGNATGAADFGSGTTSAQTLRVSLATDTSLTTSDAALANTAIANAAKTLASAGTAEAAISSALANRKYMYLYNNDNTTVFIGAASVTEANGFPVSPGSYMEMRAGAAVSPFFVGRTGKTPQIRTMELS